MDLSFLHLIRAALWLNNRLDLRIFSAHIQIRKNRNAILISYLRFTCIRIKRILPLIKLLRHLIDTVCICHLSNKGLIRNIVGGGQILSITLHPHNYAAGNRDILYGYSSQHLNRSVRRPYKFSSLQMNRRFTGQSQGDRDRNRDPQRGYYTGGDLQCLFAFPLCIHGKSPPFY